MGEEEKDAEANVATVLHDFTVSDFFNLVFNINDRLAGGEEIAQEVLAIMERSKSLDSFLRTIPDWLMEFLGGGLAALYFKTDGGYVLRKVSGQLTLYEEMPSLMDKEMAAPLNQAIDDSQLFIPIGSVPRFPTELKVPPAIRFVLAGKIGKDTEYLLTGIIPNITSYSISLFFDRLKRILGGVSDKHFMPQPEWDKVFSTLDEMMVSNATRQKIAEYIYAALNEYVNLNRLSLVRFDQLENRLVVEAAVTAAPSTALGENAFLPVEGSAFEKVIETGKAYLNSELSSSISTKAEYIIYKEGVRSYLLLPVKNENSIVGILNVGSSMSGEYLGKHLPIFDTVARYLSKILAAQEHRRAMQIYSEQSEKWHDQLNALENIRTMGELTSGVFHDLNNVMGAILGRSQIMGRKIDEIADPELAAKFRRDVELIERSAMDSGEILQRLRQLYRPGRHHTRSVVIIQEIINDAVEMIRPRWERLCQEKGVRLILRKELSEELKIMADPSELREVFTNLLLNALDAMPQGGEIGIICKRMGNQAEIVVKDTGEGISPDILEKIFEPFFTTKGDKGTGLGLPTSQRIIVSHGGEMKAVSTPGQGTSFTIYLPISEEVTLGDANKGLKASNNLPLRILIVEDKADLKEILQEMLVSYGFEVQTAESGEDAIRICARGKFDLLISDLGLPGMSGLDLISQIRAFDKKIRTILISGWEVDTSVNELMAKGVDSLMTKPFKIESILETLQNLVGLDSSIRQ